MASPTSAREEPPRRTTSREPRATGDARAAILGRIRSALEAPGATAEATVPEIPRRYRRRGRRPRDEVTSLFAERASEYQATVRRAESAEVAGAIAQLVAERGASRLVVPHGLPPEWRPAGAELVHDDDLSPHRLDELDGVVTGCAVAIAETGTIVLDGGAGQGRRALTLVPDYHLCVVHATQIAELVPEAVERLEAAVRQGRPLTFVSGPSATSDIELDRVEGVHGPRTLDIVIAT